MVIAANADAIWVRLAATMGRPELAEDPRSATHVARGAVADAVDEIVSAWSSGLSLEELDAALTDAAVPHGLISRAPDVLEDDHYRARGTVARFFDEALDREVPMPSVVPRFSRTPGTIRWAGPRVGEHTEDVLAELGLTADERDDLRSKGVVPTTRVGSPPSPAEP